MKHMKGELRHLPVSSKGCRAIRRFLKRRANKIARRWKWEN